MPPHPLDASYCHVIEAGLTNVRRLTAQGNVDQVVVELDHLDAVTRLLTRCLLYGGGDRFDESEHFDYWYQVRADYITRADPASVAEMEVAWSFVGGMVKAMEYWRTQKPT